jgi:hypothetical protein
MEDYFQRAGRLFCLTTLFMTSACVGSEEQLVCPSEAFSDYKQLQRALDDGQKDVLLCSILALDEDKPLTIRSNVRMECSNSSGCAILGGREQIILEGEGITSVLFKGISFTNSSQTSISIFSGTPKGTTTVVFQSCIWEAITGMSAINIEPVLNETTAGRSLERTSLLQQEERWTVESNLEVEIKACLFQDITVDQSLIIQTAGRLTISETVFSRNEVEEGLLVSSGGTLQIIDSELRDNTILSGRAPFLLGLNVSLDANEGNCGEDRDTCNGILTQTGECTKAQCDVVCDSLDVCPPEPTLSPSLTPAPSLTVSPTPRGTQVTELTIGTTNNIKPNEEESPATSQAPTLTVAPSLTPIPSVSPSRTLIPTQPNSAVICPNDELILGYTDIELLQSDLTNGVFVQFVLCPGTTFSGQLRIDFNVTDATSITCGDRECVWEGGESHILVLSNVNLVLEGITFRQSTNVSVLVQSNSSDQGEIVFRNCTWEGNEGAAAIWLIGGENAFSVNGTENRRLQESSTNVILDECYFSSNKVNDVILVQQGATLDITDCIFLQNIAESTLVASIDGITSVATSRFESNEFNSSRGLVTLSAESVFNLDGSCVIDNKASKSSSNETLICVGVLVEKSSDSCGDLDVCTGECLELEPCKEDSRDDCINNWLDLASEMRLIPFGGAVFVLCPDTLYDLDLQEDMVPLTISESNTVIKCGTSGERENNCVISGGKEQIRIEGSPIGVAFKGVTFTRSRRIAIVGEGNSTSQASFRFCSFVEHKGLAVAANHYVMSSVSNGTSVLDIEAPTDRGMGLDFHSCLFQDNTVEWATVIDAGGSIVLNDNVFIGNSGQAGVAASLFGGDIAVSSSCIIGNIGKIGTIYVGNSSFLRQSLDNFGINNAVESVSCTDLYVSPKECMAFDALSCDSSIQLNPSDLEKYSNCFSDFSTFATALSSNRQGGVFEICAGSIFDFEGQSGDPGFLRIKASNITVKCGGNGSRLNKCIFNGGVKQIDIQGSLTDIQFLGITFSGASEQSILVAGSAPMSIEFRDCIFQDANGTYVIEVRSNDPATTRPTLFPTGEAEANGDALIVGNGNDDIFKGGRMLDESNEVRIVATFSDCSFQRNVVDGNMIFGAGATVNVAACDFDSNSVGGSMLNVNEGGTLNLEATCFTNNTYNGLQGLVSSDSQSTIDFSQIFGSGNSDESGATKDSCTGIANGATGECDEFDASICQSLQIAECIEDWDVLADAVATARATQRGGVFILCEDSTMFPGEFDAINIDTSDTVIQCGTSGERVNRCVISGGATHFKITGSPTGVVLQGITLFSSSIVAIDAAGESSARLSIVDCAFAYNSGFAAISVYNGDLRSQQSPGRRRRLADVEDLLPPTGSMTIEVRQSYFENNEVSYAPLAVLGGTANVDETGFFENTGEAIGVGVWFAGSIDISNSCFTGSKTPILVSDGSSIRGAVGVYGSVDSNAECNGAVVGGQCIEFSADTCPVEENIVLPPTQGCYDNWLALDKAIQEAMSSQRLSVKLTACGNTRFELNDLDESVAPIVVSEARNLTISCGESDKSLDGNCTVSGGRGHFRFSSKVGAVAVNGFTFVGATVASIQATGERAAVVSLNNCRWNENSGNAVIVIYNENDVGSIYAETDFANLPPPKEKAMTMKIDSCDISSNSATYSALLNLGGKLNLLETIFADNSESRIGTIAALHGAVLGISSSCFTGNLVITTGVIFVDQTSNVTQVRNNYGYENVVAMNNCSAVFKERPGSSCVDSGDCDGDCLVFDSRTCQLVDLDEIGTLAPTVTPTQFPTQAESDETDLPDEQEPNGGKKSFLNPTLIAGLSVSVVLFIGAAASFLAIRNASGAGKRGKQTKSKSQGDLSKIEEGDEEDDETRPIDGRDNEKFLDEPEDESTKKGGFLVGFGFGRKKASSKDDEDVRFLKSIVGQDIEIGEESSDNEADQLVSGENQTGEVLENSNVSAIDLDRPERESSDPSIHGNSIRLDRDHEEESHSDSTQDHKETFDDHKITAVPLRGIDDIKKMGDSLGMPSDAYIEGTADNWEERSLSPPHGNDAQPKPKLRAMTKKLSHVFGARKRSVSRDHTDSMEASMDMLDLALTEYPADGIKKDFVRIPRTISKRSKAGSHNDSVESLTFYRDAPTTY